MSETKDWKTEYTTWLQTRREKHDRVIALTAGDGKNIRPLQSSAGPVSIGEAMKR